MEDDEFGILHGIVSVCVCGVRESEERDLNEEKMN